MFVVIETNSWSTNEGAYLFDTFKEAFNYLATRFNLVFTGWNDDEMEKCSNVEGILTDKERTYYEERLDTDQLAFWCHDLDSDGTWSNGIHLELYMVQNR